MTEAGRHYDDGKPRVDLISPQALTALGTVLSYGAKKYGDKNWLNGIAWTKLYGSALRHLLSWRRGETLDPESGLPHLAHAMCNVMMLLHYAETGKDVWDDRAPEPPKFRPEDRQPGNVLVIDKGQ